MTTRLAIVGDQPTRDPKLGFESYASALIDAIEGGQPAQYTLGLYGPWGSGKSSLLGALASGLRDNGKTVVIEFDAWRYQPGGELVASLLTLIARSLSGHAKLREFGEKIWRVVTAMVRATSLSVGEITGPKATIDGEVLVDALSQSRAPLNFVDAIQEMRAAADAVSGERIVVLIDDLDRCSPSNLVSVLETINNVMDLEGFVFVIALDYDVLVKAITVAYPHVSGHEFIEKMVQIPFRVPPLNTASAHVLRDLLPNLNSLVSLQDERFQSTLLEVIRRALRGNPRQAKRLVNSYLVLDRILVAQRSNSDRTLLLIVLGLQFGWPDAYRRLQRAVTIGALERAGELHDYFLEATDEQGLADFLDKALLDELASVSLLEIIHLAAATAPSTFTDDYDVQVEDLAHMLAVHGWVEVDLDIWKPGDDVEQGHIVRLALRGKRVAIEMREYTQGNQGKKRSAKTVFHTITHVPISDAQALEPTIERLSSSAGLSAWRKEKMAQRQSRLADVTHRVSAPQPAARKSARPPRA